MIKSVTEAPDQVTQIGVLYSGASIASGLKSSIGGLLLLRRTKIGSVSRTGSANFLKSNVICLVIALILCVAAANAQVDDSGGSATPTDFVVFEGKLYLIGSDQAELRRSCEQVREYGRFIRVRNGLDSASARESHFCPSEFAAPRGVQKEFQRERQRQKAVPNYLRSMYQEKLERRHLDWKLPSYNLGASLFGLLSSSERLWLLDVSSLVPHQLWKPALENKSPIDRICYNMALVGSGILPFSHLSVFVSNIDFYLGMAAASIEPEAGDRSDSPIRVTIERKGLGDALVEYRNQWGVNIEKKKSGLDDISNSIREHFTPGSVMCLRELGLVPASKLLEDSRNFVKTIAPHRRVEVFNLLNLKPEDKGDHCFVFLTPDLVLDANAGAHHRLGRWRDLYIHQNWGYGETGFYYFQIRPEEILREAQNPDSKLHALDRLLPLLRRHRQLYENLDPNGCPKGIFGGVNFYARGDCPAKGKLKRFLQKEHLDIDGSNFGDGIQWLGLLKKINDDPAVYVEETMRGYYRESLKN